MRLFGIAAMTVAIRLYYIRFHLIGGVRKGKGLDVDLNNEKVLHVYVLHAFRIGEQARTCCLYTLSVHLRFVIRRYHFKY